ncbi:peptidase S1 and S6, chymotrypsin/Hap [gamma proteobacterium HTCC5015]|nr:peptidase S1 and S6, chymotrypsin/Hap [gamma proteobacterium HTCC5015]
MSVARLLLQSLVIGFLVGLAVVGFRYWQDGNDHKTVEVVQRSASQATAGGPFSYAEAVATAMPSVVSIYTARVVANQGRFRNPILDRLFGTEPQNQIKTGSGSGVIFSDQGYLLTNYHVIAGAEEVRVSTTDGRDFAAQLIGADPETDLAVLAIEASDLEPITLAPSESHRVGDVALAIGNPFGVGQTVTMGIISATGRDRLGLNTFENFIQTDAAINPGNSGGALVNAHGELIGINTAIFSQDGGSQGIGFAIPADMASSVLAQILEHGQVIRGWIGAEGRDLSAYGKQQLGVDSGVILVGVVEDGPSALAGLRQGDIITHIDGKVVEDVRDVLDMVASRKPGDSMKIEGIRKNQTFEATLVVVQRPLMSR